MYGTFHKAVDFHFWTLANVHTSFIDPAVDVGVGVSDFQRLCIFH